MLHHLAPAHPNLDTRPTNESASRHKPVLRERFLSYPCGKEPRRIVAPSGSDLLIDLSPSAETVSIWYIMDRMLADLSLSDYFPSFPQDVDINCFAFCGTDACSGCPDAGIISSGHVG